MRLYKYVKKSKHAPFDKPNPKGMRHPRAAQHVKGVPPSMKASALSRDTNSLRAAKARLSFHLEGSFLFLFPAFDQGSLVNLAVDSGSTNHLFGHELPTMILSSDAAITRGSKAPNQASDELVFIRVAPGLPCLRTSCA